MRTFDDMGKVTEIDWQTFLMNGKPVTKAGLHVIGMAHLPSGIDIHYNVFRFTFGGPGNSNNGTPATQIAAAAAAAAGMTAGLATPGAHPLDSHPLLTQQATPAPSGLPTGSPGPATGSPGPTTGLLSPPDGPHERVLMIMGFAAPADAWLPLLHQMQRLSAREMPPSPRCTLEVCTFDNRGIGGSSVPADKKVYTTDSMALDALGVMDNLGWDTAHIVGFSMGGMIATKLACMAPHRARSLTLVSVTGGNWQVLPLTAAAFRTAVKGLMDKSNEGRAKMDVKFHFARGTRWALHNGQRIGELLVQEYIKESEVNGRQPQAGEDGHLHAVWNHEVTDANVRTLKAAGLPITVIHGIHDLMAQPKYGRRMAARLGARLVLVDGGHFTPRENATEIAQEILGTAFAKAGLEWRAPGLRRPVYAGDAVAGGEDPLLDGAQAGGLTTCFACCA